MPVACAVQHAHHAEQREDEQRDEQDQDAGMEEVHPPAECRRGLHGADGGEAPCRVDERGAENGCGDRGDEAQRPRPAAGQGLADDVDVDEVAGAVGQPRAEGCEVKQRKARQLLRPDGRDSAKVRVTTWMMTEAESTAKAMPTTARLSTVTTPDRASFPHGRQSSEVGEVGGPEGRRRSDAPPRALPARRKPRVTRRRALRRSGGFPR